MDLKLIFGIFIPLVIVVSLIVISSLNIGFSIETKTVQSLKFDSLFAQQNQAKDSVTIRNITITNDYFLSKRIKLPSLMICLNDKEGIKPRQNLQVRYNEGISYPSSENRMFEAAAMEKSISSDYYGYYGTSTKAIEISAHNKKQVKVLIDPQILYNYNYNYQDMNNYKDYDELLLIEKKSDSYTQCQNLESRELDNAVHIQITEIPSKDTVPASQIANINPPATPVANTNINYACTDSDGGINFNVAGTTSLHYKTVDNKDATNSAKDSCYDSTNFVDSCSGNTCSISEHYCISNNSMTSIYDICTNGCKDGACIP